MTEEERADVEETEEKATDVTADDLPYTMGEWCGLPLWKCRYCLHATPDGEYAFYKHLERHLTNGSVPASGLVDPRGKPL